MSGDHNMYASGSGDGQRSGWRKRTIAEMARETKMPYDFVTGEPINLEKLEAFAALVREEALAQPEQDYPKDFIHALAFHTAMSDLEPEQEPVAVYGYCPQCGAKGVMRERRPNGNDKCANGHSYPSSTSTPPQRTWVGLTDAEVKKIVGSDRYTDLLKTVVQAVEAKLKEKNT